jgi:glycerate kinase
MIWIFLTAVLVLMVLHPGFRKVALVLGGIAAFVALIGMLNAMSA